MGPTQKLLLANVTGKFPIWLLSNKKKTFLISSSQLFISAAAVVKSVFLTYATIQQIENMIRNTDFTLILLALQQNNNLESLKIKINNACMFKWFIFSNLEKYLFLK